MGHMCAGGVSMQNLKEENLYRDDRIEHRPDPRHPAIMTRLGDSFGVKLFGPILLELTNHIRDTAHGGVSCYV
jgi:hypothetical protein